MRGIYSLSSTLECNFSTKILSLTELASIETSRFQNQRKTSLPCQQQKGTTRETTRSHGQRNNKKSRLKETSDCKSTGSHVTCRCKFFHQRWCRRHFETTLRAKCMHNSLKQTITRHVLHVIIYTRWHKTLSVRCTHNSRMQFQVWPCTYRTHTKLKPHLWHACTAHRCDHKPFLTRICTHKMTQHTKSEIYVQLTDTITSLSCTHFCSHESTMPGRQFISLNSMRYLPPFPCSDVQRMISYWSTRLYQDILYDCHSIFIHHFPTGPYFYLHV